jgi:hypothetical protein
MPRDLFTMSARSASSRAGRRSLLGNARLCLAVVALACLATGPARAQCLVIGDSIAVGLAEQFSQCRSWARNGLTSAAIVRLAASAPSAPWVAISAGSNDAANGALSSNLDAIRNRIRAIRVVWIVPRNRRAAAAVRRVAGTYGDAVVSFASRDGVHPVSYPALARSVAGW